MSETVVETKWGKLKGKVVSDSKGGKNFAFLGIPYAKSPTGNRRFKKPEHPEPWVEIRDATEEGSPCKSKHSEKNIIQGSEDCLFINVYTPQLPKNTKESSQFPVMVFVHGGGFHMGSSSCKTFGPDYILSEKVVFVSFNYRLGIFGFLSLKDESLEVPGNVGLKDQLMALTWVQENISCFSGDPNNVTIFGHSAGSASVHYLVLSQKSKGLFHKAILQSGTALNIWARGDSHSELIRKYLGIEEANDTKILKELYQRSTDELFQLQEDIISKNKLMYNRPWVPVIEPPSSNALISELPVNIIKSGNYNKVPLIIGYSNREGIFSRIINLKQQNKSMKVKFEEQVCNHFSLTLDGNECNDVAKEVKKFYFGNEEPSDDNLDNIFTMNTDMLFLRGIYQSLKFHMETNTSPVYFYRFSFDGRLNFLKSLVFKLKDAGACHGDDLGYIFKTEWTPEIIPNSSEDIIRKSIVRLWTNFSKYGDPNGNKKNGLIKVTWKPVDIEQLHYLEIGENLTVGIDPDQTRMNFFDKVEQNFKPRYASENFG